MESAINAKQIKVVFNKEVDKTTAENASKYVITSANADAVAGKLAIAPDAVKLQNDKKSVIITLTNALNAKVGAKYFVSVEDVKNVSGAETIPDFSEVVSLYDNAALAVQEVTYPDSNTLRVKFSEPVNTIDGSSVASAFQFTLDGVNVVVPATAFTLNAAKTTVDIDLAGAGLTAGKGYKLTIDGLTDFAANALPKYETTVSFVKDEIKPTVESITAVSANTIKVVFSEKIKDSSAIKVNVDGVQNAGRVITNATTPADGKSFIITLPGVTAGNKLVAIYDFVDVAGNKGDTKTQEVKFVASKPVLSSTTPVIKDIAGKKYVIYTFDREVKKNVTSVNAEYVNKDNITKTTTLTVVDSTTNGIGKNQISLDITSAEAGTYSFKFAAGNVQDVFNQNADATTLGFVRTAETVKTTVSNVVGNSSDLKSVTVSFAANVSDAALNVANYTVNGVNVFEKAVFAGDRKTVKLTVKDGAIATSGNKTVAVTGIENVENYSNASVSFIENVKPVVVKNELIGYNKIRLTFTESVSLTGADDFEITVGGNKISKPYTVSGQNTDVLVITLDAADKLTSSSTEVKVKVVDGNDIADGVGNKVATVDLGKSTVNFVDTTLAYNNAVMALETAINKDLSVSSNLVAAKNALKTAHTAQNAVAVGEQTHALTLSDATLLLTTVDNYVAVKANASTKAAETKDATQEQLNEAKTAIEEITTAKTAVDSAAGSLTITALSAALATDTTNAQNVNKATVKDNMNAKFAVNVTEDQAGTGKGKFTITAPWLAAADLYDATKFTFTLSDVVNSEVAVDGTVGFIVKALTTTQLTGTQTVKVKPQTTAGSLEEFFGADEEITLTLVNQEAAPTIGDAIEIAVNQ